MRGVRHVTALVFDRAREVLLNRGRVETKGKPSLRRACRGRRFGRRRRGKARERVLARGAARGDDEDSFGAVGIADDCGARERNACRTVAAVEIDRELVRRRGCLLYTSPSPRDS